MRKTFSALLLAIAFLLLLFARFERWEIVAPEMFGRSEAYLMRSPMVAVIPTEWNLLVLYGSNDDCRIVFVAGIKPGQYFGPVQCAFRYSDESNRFAGWIDFRGHHRPLCGTQTGDFMAACKDW